jgi:hypothetical protein
MELLAVLWEARCAAVRVRAAAAQGDRAVELMARIGACRTRAWRSAAEHGPMRRREEVAEG